jgi:hypothetical protein
MNIIKRHFAPRHRRGGDAAPRRQVRDYRPLDDPLGLEIQNAMTADKAGGGSLRWCEPKPDGWEFDGYCAVAATAYLFLKGEELAGADPLAPAETGDWETAGRAAYDAGYRSCCSYGGGHWWLEHRQNDQPPQVIDLNIGVHDANDDFPYVEQGHGQKFQGAGYAAPSKRALELIQRVKDFRVKNGVL